MRQKLVVAIQLAGQPSIGRARSIYEKHNVCHKCNLVYPKSYIRCVEGCNNNLRTKGRKVESKAKRVE